MIEASYNPIHAGSSLRDLEIRLFQQHVWTDRCIG